MRASPRVSNASVREGGGRDGVHQRIASVLATDGNAHVDLTKETMFRLSCVVIRLLMVGRGRGIVHLQGGSMVLYSSIRHFFMAENRNMKMKHEFHTKFYISDMR